jgi:hypothetical protein
MKRCGICGVEKDDAAFNQNKTKHDGLQSKCKQCPSVYLQSHYQRHKEYYVAKARVSKLKTYQANRILIDTYLAEHPCVDCGETDPIVLEFDHVRGVKSNSVSVLAFSLGVAQKRLIEEIAKCEIRCANCHRRKTAIQMKWGHLGTRYNSQTSA